MAKQLELEETLNEETGSMGPEPKKSHFVKTKHLLGILGLGSGTGLVEIDTLDRLNDVGVTSTPTSVSYTPGGHYLLRDLADNPIYHDLSHFFVNIGISGGPNNTLGILAAAAALTIGGLSARSYIKDAKKSDNTKPNLKKAAISAALLTGGVYIGSQSFLPVVNDVLYKAPVSTLGYAAAGAVGILSGIYMGIDYLKTKHAYKKQGNNYGEITGLNSEITYKKD